MAINSLQAPEVSDQMKNLQPTMLDLTEGAILRDVGNLTGTVKMPKRILNMLGEINAYSVFANNPGAHQEAAERGPSRRHHGLAPAPQNCHRCGQG